MIRSLTLTVFCLSLLTLVSCDTSKSAASNQRYSSNSKRPPAVPGKCYAKAMMPDVVSKKIEAYPVYTGNDAENDYIEIVSVELTSATTRWEKKRAPGNCNAPDPNDCLVWCLVDVPAKIETMTVVTDTSMLRDYEWRSVTITTIEKKGGHTEWVEVICEGDLTRLVIADIATKLKDRGYYEGAIPSKMSTPLKSALTKYQKKQGLPVGNLDTTTLAELSVRY